MGKINPLQQNRYLGLKSSYFSIGVRKLNKKFWDNPKNEGYNLFRFHTSSAFLLKREPVTF